MSTRRKLDPLANMKMLENYGEMLAELTSDRIVGHHKVIRYADGLPVSSLMLPPLYSGPYATIQIQNEIRTIRNAKMPQLATLALTDKCNADCEHCSFFDSIEDPSLTPLSLDEIKDVIRQAQALGVSVFNLLGGEPLMHPNWREILSAIDKKRSHIIMFTNGWFLADAALDLKKHGLGGVYVSIDGSTAEIHDKKRGLTGLFDKAMEGIKAAIKADLTVGISTCIDQAGFESGELDNIIELAREKGVHEVLVFDAMPVGKLQGRNDLRGTKPWLETMMERVRPYNQNDDYPGILIYAYFTSHMSMGCPGGSSYFYVSPYGDVCPCDFHHHRFGNVRENKVATLWDIMTNGMGKRGSNWQGCWAKNSEAPVQ